MKRKKEAMACGGEERSNRVAHANRNEIPILTISSPFPSMPDTNAGPPTTILSIFVADSMSPTVALEANPVENVSERVSERSAVT